MRIRLLAAAALLLAACTDDLPTTSPLSPGGVSPRANTYSQPATWRAHWQSSRDLWIYDKSPEIGFNIHMDGQALQEHHMDMVHNAGMRLVRVSLYWIEVDPDGDGIYDPNMMAAIRDRVDKAMNGTRELELMFVVHGMWTNADAATANQPLPWKDDATVSAFNQHFATFLNDMATAFPEVKFWQIWNEQDNSGWAKPWRDLPGGNSTNWGASYASTLRAVYPGLKARGRWVVSGGLEMPSGLLEGQSVEFVRGMYQGFEATGGKPYPLDIMALHAYGANPYDPWGPFTRVHKLTPVMNAFGDVNRPIWITETGTSGQWYLRAYGVPGGDSDAMASTYDEHQRSYYDALVNGLYDTPITKVLGYNMYTAAGDSGVSFPDGRPAADYNLSLTRKGSNPMTPRPAWQWLTARSATNRAQWDRPASTGDYQITTFGLVPSNHAFQYQADGSLVVQGVTVNTLTPTSVPFMLPLGYQVSIVGVGATGTVYNNQVAGYDTQQKYMNRLRVQPLDVPTVACYQVHQSNLGDRPVVCSNWSDPWTGDPNQRIEQIRITVDNPAWSICYQVFAWNNGWTPWACNGDWAGSRGLARSLGAMRVRMQRN
ncbi:MAG TPA: cellulase family glycosylhydrolase [Longimicrobium sp.]|jgi:hypothetical protein